MNSSSFISILFRFTVTGVVGLTTIWLSLGRMAAEKIATALILPAGLLWLFLLFSTAYAVAARQRTPAMCLLLAWLMLSVIGNGFLSDQLAMSLERPYRQIDPFAAEPFDAVVVLGGGGGLGANERHQGNASGDRLILAAQLYHRGVARKLICTGQRIESMDSTGVDPATVTMSVLKELGVPETSMEMAGGRNTAEEMQNLGKRFRDPATRVGLVTSEWHLPRALMLAERQGFRPTALPADFKSAPRSAPPTPGQIIESMIPSGVVIASNSAFLKEYLGTVVGR